MLQPENQPKKYEHLFSDIDRGIIKVPKFQRDFIWSKEQSAKLIDSIIKGFPIGTFIIWKTKDELRHFKNIGNAKLPEIRKGDFIYYVASSIMKCNTWESRKGDAILSVYGKTIQTSYYDRTRTDSQNEV